MTEPSSYGSSNNQLPACDDCRKRKIRCDRRVPQCSNCQRSRVSCLFTNEGKKQNTTKQLVDDVAGLSSRLSAIDDTNAKLLQRIDALTAEISRSRQQTPASASATPRASHQGSEDSASPQSPDQTPRSAQGSTAGLSNLIVDGSGGEQFYGASSTLALLRHARDEVDAFVKNALPQTSPMSAYPPNPHSTSPTSRSSSVVVHELQRRIDAIDNILAHTAESQDEYEPMADKAGLTLPPRELLDGSVGVFFDDSNLERLIFHKGNVLDAIEQHYQPNAPKRDEAWLLCFNNIVLLSMSGRSKVFRDGQYVLSNIDYDLFESRVEAAKRTLHRIEQFSKPRFINVQTLLTLSLVARKFFTFQAFERIFHRACQLAKHMGLQEGLYSQEMSPTMQEERKNVMWALYAVDKQRFVVKDVPCQLYLFELNLDLPNSSDSSSLSPQDLLIARLRLTTFLEELYKQLNSPQARRQDSSRRQCAIASLNRQLDTWWENHQALLTQCDANGQLTVASMHLRYFFLSTKVLIHRVSEEDRDRMMSVNYSTEALRIVQRLCSGNTLLDGGLLALDRLFRSCSVVPYYVLFEYVLKSRQAREHSDHMSLLVACTNALAQVALPKYTESYFARMHIGMSWCTDALRIIRKSERPQAPIPGAFEASGPMNTQQTPVMSYQPMPFPQYQSFHPTGNYLPMSTFPSHTDSATTGDPNSTVRFSDGTSSRPDSGMEYSDFATGRGNMGSTSSASSGNYGSTHSTVAQAASIQKSGGLMMNTSAPENMNAMFIDDMNPQQRPTGSSAGEYPLNPAMFQDLLGPNPYMDDRQF